MDSSVAGTSRQSLPVISFAEPDETVLGRQLDQAFSTFGFCYFRDIGVAPAPSPSAKPTSSSMAASPERPICKRCTVWARNSRVVGGA